MQQRAGIYLRLSNLDGRDGEANSIAGQRRDCLAYCEARDWEVTEFVDEGISASKGLDRPSYNAMLDAMANHDLDHIVAAKQDRYTRDRDIEWGQLVSLAIEAGVEVHTADSGPLRLETPDGALSAGIRSEFAAFESRIIRARTRRGFQTRREAGEWGSFGGKTYGYLKGGIVNQEQAAHVRWAYDQILNHGRNVQYVFDTWRRDGVLTVRGKQWTSADRVAATLRNPVLAGLVVHKGKILGPGRWEAIVTPDERERVSELISANASKGRGYGQRRARKRFLAGLVLCGRPECDLLPMTSHNPGPERAYYWSCDPRRGGCRSRVRGDLLEQWAKVVAVGILEHATAPETKVPEFDDTPLRAIEAQIDEVREAVANLTMRVSDAAPMLATLRGKLAEQQAAREEHEQEARVVESWHTKRIDAVMAGDREAVAAVLDNVRVLPDKQGFIFEARRELELLGVRHTWRVVPLRSRKGSPLEDLTGFTLDLEPSLEPSTQDPDFRTWTGGYLVDYVEHLATRGDGTP